MRHLLSARRNTLPASSSSDVSRTLQFMTPPFLTPVVASIMTPKIDMVYSPSSVNYSYTEPLNFLDDQQSFNNAFGNIPVMLLISDRSSRAIEDSKTLRSKILDLCSLSHLHIFCDIIQLQYVGTATYDSK